MNKLRTILPIVVKKHVWDLKYGVLGYPVLVAPEDVLRYFSSCLSDQTSILDLGCGRGSLLRALRESGWRGNYCGVDISKQAIRDAREFVDQRTTWAVSDFESFRSPAKWHTITMIESIYYVPLGEVPKFLTGLMGMLDNGGRILFRLHDLDEFSGYIDLIYKMHPMTERVAEHLFCIPAAGVTTA
jgi:2-polyprenyl-3-methyl-5-hydroxy-6-metoxy-1,4-benzoquinol methylase